MRHSFWIVIFSLTLALAYSTQAKTITITAADSFKKAVESASENDTIIVTAGIYRENEIKINKRIT
ncbi:MAG: nitrous oxide reductase family maturation protein NosD, partial [candidate division Zixibacteria bacterium]|nr:nitrous oxide reductase family maturation protein NosD [candidate division Zixibacteria bacterium]